jgi:hypothetical protein
MFFVWGVHQRRLMGLVVTALAAVLVSSCGGGGSEEDSAQHTTTAGGSGEQASKADLDAALKKSVEEVISRERCARGGGSGADT